MNIKSIKLNLDKDIILAFSMIFMTGFAITIPFTYQTINQANQHRLAVKHAQQSPIIKAGEEIKAKLTPEGEITFKIATGEKIILIREENNTLMIQSLSGRIGYINKDSQLELNL